MDTIFSIIILVMSVAIHEVSHGVLADKLGDPTPRAQGRLTLNPLAHLDPFGSVLLPLILSIVGAPVFGWAKPVIVNPNNFNIKRWGEAIVALAGPLSNITIALFFGLIIRFGGLAIPSAFVQISILIVLVNLMLAIFNLIPVPPLDGSRVLFALYPNMPIDFRIKLETFGFMFAIALILFFGHLLIPILDFFFSLITGLNL